VRRSGLLLCAAWLSWASVTRAEAPAKLSPTVFWLSASATVLCASLGGFYALEVKDLYDEAQMSAPVSPERARLHDEMTHAELTADLLLFGSLVLATGTTILAFHVDWSGRDRAGSSPLAAVRGTGVSFTLDPGVKRPQLTAAADRSWW
jgi:hypothetical protein